MSEEYNKNHEEKEAIKMTREGIKLRDIIQSVKMVND